MSQAAEHEVLPADRPGPSLPTDAELNASLNKIVSAAVHMIGARYGVLVLFDDRSRVGVFAQTCVGGAPEAEDLRDRPAASLDAFRTLVDIAGPIRIDDVRGSTGGAELLPGIGELGALIAVPVTIRGIAAGGLLVADRLDGTPFDDDDTRRLAPLASAIQASVENDLLYAEMRRRERWLEASTQMTTTVLSGASTDEVLSLVARLVSECTPADGVAILLVEPEGGMFVERATGEASELFAGMVGDDSWASSAAAIHTGEPVVVPDLGATGKSEHPVFRRLGPCMLLPMRAADQTLGAIAVTNYRGGRRFDPMDVAMAQAFAGQTALAAVLSNVRTERERLIVFEERDRIARDLHDLVIQRLFATGMMLQGAGRNEALPPEAADRVGRAVDELDATVREIRQTIFALNQPLDGMMATSLRGRILHEVAVAVPGLGFQPHLRIDGAVDTLVPDEIANDLVAATREALSNVVRHAQATSVDVHMGIRGDDVVLEVVDDGIGIRDGGRRSGLRNLAVRATGANGRCSTWPAKPDGTGTRLTFQARIR